MEQRVNVVWEQDLNESGTRSHRIAEIEGEFYPYVFDMNRGQVTWGNAFAKHSNSGVMYVSHPYKTKAKAIAAF